MDTLDCLRQAEERTVIWTFALERVEDTLVLLHDAEAYLWEGKAGQSVNPKVGEADRPFSRLFEWTCSYRIQDHRSYYR